MSCLISKAPLSVTRSAQSPCVSQLSTDWAGWRAAAAQPRAAVPHAWAGPGNELSLWGTWGPCKECGSLHPCLMQPAGQSLFPLGVAGNRFSTCHKSWYLQMPEAWASVIIFLLIDVGSVESCWILPAEPIAESDHAFNCHKLLSIWDHLTPGLQTLAYGPIPAFSLFLWIVLLEHSHAHLFI